MNLKEFARAHRLKTRNPEEDGGELVVNGKSGQIYDYGEGRLAVSFTPGLDKNRRGIGVWVPARWTNRRRDAVAAGMTVIQDGDSEGSLSFDPENADQARLALKIARISPRRLLSPELAAQKRSYLEKIRLTARQG